MTREVKYDILKVIGLLFIILAHVNPPTIIFQIRNFDVVLMILISAYLGIKSTNNIGYLMYLLKRFKRLIMPTWIFISGFLLICYIFKLCSIDRIMILNSFALGSRMGYIWVIRIYFLISILIPIYKLIILKTKKITSIPLIILIYIGYEILCHYGIFNNKIISYLFAYIAPCCLLIAISKIMFNSSDKKLIFIGTGSFIILISIGTYLYIKTGIIQPTQIMKYPFRLYYLSYGIFVSSILIYITNKKKVCDILNNKFVTFISTHSLWIYLWHVLMIYFLKKLNFNINWALKYIIVLGFALFVTYIQSLLVEKLENDKNKKITDLFKS